MVQVNSASTEPTLDSINRGIEQIQVSTSCGDDFTIECNEDRSVAQIKREIEERTGVPAKSQLIMQDGKIVNEGSVEAGRPVEVRYNMAGGVDFQIKTDFPTGLCREKCLCCECHWGDFPDIAKEDFITNLCLCIESKCGLDDWMRLRYCCLVLDLNPFKFELDTNAPDCIKTQCLISKCALKLPLMDIAKEPFISRRCFCLFDSCDFSMDMKEFQYFCLYLKL
uniref:Ubiquitin-like domain-containing protein n=1 Tax=Heterosigma akashiwo TaxID=2829 RepID=A0A6V2WFW1_HETAK